MINVKRFKSPILNQIIFKNKNNSMINSVEKDDNNKMISTHQSDEKEEIEEYDEDKDEEKETFQDIGSVNNNQINKFDISYKSTETKNTLIQNESKVNS